jgi:colanic acid biosynthesis glycosyl transferase WcaI
MRILIVSQYFYPESFRVNQLAESLQMTGHRVVVLTGQPNYPTGRFFSGYTYATPAREYYRGVEVVRIPIVPRGDAGPFRLAINYLSFAFSGTLLGLLRLSGTFDVCLVFCPSPLTAAIPAIVYRICTRTPVAIWLQDLWPDVVFDVTGYKSDTFFAALKFMVRWTYKHLDRIWIQSPDFAESIVAHGGRPERIEYLPNWAEDLYDCAAWTETAAEPIPPNSIVFAGNLGRAQGLETIIEAATITHDMGIAVHWVFVGDGSLRDWLEAERTRRALNQHVTLLPRRCPRDIPKLFKSAAALLITLGRSASFVRTIPSKVQSCLAAGRPILAALDGVSEAILKDAGCGILCAAGDALALADGAKRLVALSPEERAGLGARGHAYYRAHFRQATVLARVDTLLREMSSPHSNLAKHHGG